jgi:hypothetical protein
VVYNWFMAPAKSTAAVLLAAALSLWGSIQYLHVESAWQRQSSDPYRIADQAARFAEFRTAVSANSILGYLTDIPTEDVLATSMFLGAQYELAPRILQKSDSFDAVLGNFTRPADFASLGKQHGLRLERDFGNGVVLFRREAHP